MCLRAGLEGTENLAHRGIRTPDLLPRRESLYRLYQLGHQILYEWQGSTQERWGRALQPTSLKSKFKEHRLCRQDDFKGFKSFTLPPKSATKIW